MIELFDKNFDINSIDNIYGIINVPEDRYFHGLTQFINSNMFQIKKIVEDNSITKFVAVSVHPQKNARLNSLVKEIVEIIGYEPLNKKSKLSTTGYCNTFCKPIISFNEFSKNRTFFNINPHCQYLIRKIEKQQSQKIIEYIKENYVK